MDKPSPTGTYRVKVGVIVKNEADLLGQFTEQGSVQVLKGQEVLYAHEWNRRDSLESTFIDDNPSIEWVGNDALRMGGHTSRQPFTNELLIWNDTAEDFKHIGVSFGKSESFDVFDVTPGERVVLQPSAGRNYDSSGDFDLSFGFGGQTRSGKAFQGAMQQKQPNHSVKLQIRIRPEDIN